jgi:hypothetical protein
MAPSQTRFPRATLPNRGGQTSQASLSLVEMCT